MGSPSLYSFTIRVADSGSGELQQTATYSCTIASVVPAPAHPANYVDVPRFA